MSLLASPSDPVIVDPRDGTGVVYVLRRPVLRDRAVYRARVHEFGGRAWSIVELLDALEEAAEQLIEDNSRRQEIVDQIRDRRAAVIALLGAIDRGELPRWGEEFQSRWADATRFSDDLVAFSLVAAQHQTRYARMSAEMAALPIAQGAAAASLFFLRAERDGKPIACDVDQIPDHHLIAIGRAIEETMTLSGDRLGKSRSPSGS